MTTQGYEGLRSLAEVGVPADVRAYLKSLIEAWSLQAGDEEANQQSWSRVKVLLESGWNSADAERRREWFRVAVVHVQGQSVEEASRLNLQRGKNFNEGQWRAAQNRFEICNQILAAFHRSESVAGRTTVGDPIYPINDQSTQMMDEELALDLNFTPNAPHHPQTIR